MDDAELATLSWLHWSAPSAFMAISEMSTVPAAYAANRPTRLWLGSNHQGFQQTHRGSALGAGLRKGGRRRNFARRSTRCPRTWMIMP